MTTPKGKQKKTNKKPIKKKPGHPPAGNKKPTTTTHQEETGQSDPEQAKDQKNDSQNAIRLPARKARRRLDCVICGATVVIAIATAVYTVAAVWQLLVLGDQLDVIQQNTGLDHRAWIGLETPKPPTIKPGENLSYRVVFRNTGKTPAVDTRNMSRIVSDPNASFLASWFKESIAHDPNVGAAPLAPNAALLVSNASTNEVTEGSLDRIESGETVLFVLVKIEYSDIFDKPHTTHACLRYSPEKATLIAHHEFNYMD